MICKKLWHNDLWMNDIVLFIEAKCNSYKFIINFKLLLTLLIEIIIIYKDNNKTVGTDARV